MIIEDHTTAKESSGRVTPDCHLVKNIKDGSFIGQYVTVTKTKHRVSNELTAAVAAEASGATYV